SPLGSRPVSSLPTGGVGTGSVAAVEPLAAGAAGGPGAAMLAAPRGLAGGGTAALAAPRATGLQPDDAEEVPDHAPPPSPRSRPTTRQHHRTPLHPQHRPRGTTT